VVTVCQSGFPSFPIFHLLIVKPQTAKSLTTGVLIYFLCLSAEGMEPEKKEEKYKQIFWYPTQKQHHPWLILATPWADFVVFCVQPSQ